MANLYVRSTDGSNADNGSTWTLAKATLAGADAIDAAGDNIYLSQAHSESTASAVTYAFAGTAASPTVIVGVSDEAEPPTAESTKPTITTTGSNGITFNVVAFRCENLKLVAASGGISSTPMNLAFATGSICEFTNCDFEMAGTGSNGSIAALAASDSKITLRGCTYKFGATTQTIALLSRGICNILGGSIASGGSALTKLFNIANTSVNLFVDAFDLSNAASGVNIFGVGQASCIGVMANSKLPASWTGALTTGTLVANERYSLYNCDSGNTNYKLSIASYGGNIIHETTLVKTGGATDGTTQIAWKCVTTANSDDLCNALQTDWMAVWNTATGSSKTVTVDILHDSATALKDSDVWLEVEYESDSVTPLATIETDYRSNLIVSSTDQTSSSATWTTTGMSNPNKQKLEVTFTPQRVGWIRCRVNIAKVSYTLYVDPEPVIS